MNISFTSERARFSLIAGCLFVASCAQIPDLGPAPELLNATSLKADQSFRPQVEDWPEDEWWLSYHDEQLTSLIADGLAASPDMEMATARISQANAYARQAYAALSPTLDLQASAVLQKQSLNNGYPAEFVKFLPQGWNDAGDVALSAGYNFDFWGKTKASIAAATSDLQAAHIDGDAAKLALTSSIASAYMDLAALYTMHDIREAALQLHEASFDLVQKRVDAGLNNEGDLHLAEAVIASAKAGLAASEEAIALKKNELAALVGAGPDKAFEIERPQLETLIPHGVPEDASIMLVARRPDVLAARIRAESAAHRIDVARADFYPSVSLRGLIGLQSLGLDELISKDSIYGNVGPAISLPIFHGDAIRAEFSGARADYDAAVASYDKTVLSAYREVADVVTSESMLLPQLEQTKAALEANEKAYEIALIRYRGGLSNYLDVLNVEERLLDARSALADLELRALKLDVDLVRALGGGFDASAALEQADIDVPEEKTDG